MDPKRLFVVIIFLFVGLSGLNYLYFHERTSTIIAEARGNAIGNVIDEALGQPTWEKRELQREDDGFVNREVGLAVAAGVGIIMLRRRS